MHVGERIPESTKYCYPDYRKTAWLPIQCGQLEELLDPLNEIDQDERQSINLDEFGKRESLRIERDLHPGQATPLIFLI